MSRLGSLAVALALFSAACVAEDEDIGSATSTLWSLGTANGSPPEWDSANTSNLSAWESVMCVQDYGQNFLPTKITGFIDKGSLDDYLARAEVTCTEYVTTPSSEAYLPTGAQHSALLMSSSYQGSAIPADILATSSDGIPAGVWLGLSGNGDYVEVASLLFVHPHVEPFFLASYGTPDVTELTPLVFHLKGHDTGEQELICPDQQVMSGISVKTSTGSGKIRSVKIYCRPLTWI